MYEARIIFVIHQDIAPSEDERALVEQKMTREKHRARGAVQLGLMQHRKMHLGTLAHPMRTPFTYMRGEIAGDDRDVADLVRRERIDDVREERLARDLEHRLGHAIGRR